MQLSQSAWQLDSNHTTDSDTLSSEIKKSPSMTLRLSRRNFLSGSLALFACELIPAEMIGSAKTSADPSTRFEPWQRGILDIHHISTGRGNSVLVICPDGTSILIDAGAVKGPADAMVPARPNANRRPGEWIGRYVRHHLQTSPRQELDYAVLTHFHGDHVGNVAPNCPAAPAGDYRLTGIADVEAQLNIHKIIDRGYPNYNYPIPSADEGVANYIRFVRSIEKRGTKIEKLSAGSSRQIALQHSQNDYPTFAVRNFACNGEVWTGQDEHTLQVFPPLNSLKPEEYPTENSCSIAMRFDYGAFRYYIGGDLTCDTRFGTAPWLDVETPVAKVAGPVNVSALNHHGYFDSTGPDFVRQMRSRIYVVQAWHASHPALSVLDRLYSPLLYQGDRDVLATGLTQAASLADARFSDKMLSQHGHVIVRVSEQGRQYQVIVLDDATEEGSTKANFGPYLT
jgi:beta-lactamase superfamily II metal-dependent hydrolase